MKNTVIITGAGSGIGKATAELFSKQEWNVILCGRDLNKLNDTRTICNNSAIVQLDLTSPNSIKACADEINSKKMSINALVNNAAIFEYQNFLDYDMNHWRNMFETNFFGLIHFTQLIIPNLLKSNNPSILNVSSTLGLKPTANTGAYSASKAALVSLTYSLAQEFSPKGLRVNCICPGIVDTPIHKFHSLNESEKKEFISSNLNALQPLGRIGTPDEIAQSIYFLTCSNSSWTTGAVLSVDGGISLT